MLPSSVRFGQITIPNIPVGEGENRIPRQSLTVIHTKAKMFRSHLDRFELKVNETHSSAAIEIQAKPGKEEKETVVAAYIKHCLGLAGLKDFQVDIIPDISTFLRQNGIVLFGKG